MRSYDFRRWATGYELVNPHAEVQIRVFEQAENGDCACSISTDSVFSKTVDLNFSGDKPAFSKFRPNDPTSIHWYNAADFHALAYLGGDQAGLSVRDFVRQFWGLNRSNKAKQVCGGIVGNLTDLADDGEALERLRLAMLAESQPVKAQQFGILGEAHMIKAMCADIGRHWYKCCWLPCGRYAVTPRRFRQQPRGSKRWQRIVTARRGGFLRAGGL